MASGDTAEETTFISFQNVQPQMFYPSSPTEAIVTSTSDIVPYIEITIQPSEKFRFRYKSELGSHGAIPGEGYPQVKKKFPTVKLHNYNLPRKVCIKVSLYTADQHPRPHVLELVGKTCTDGVCYQALDKSFCAKFQGISIWNKKKDEVLEILKGRKISEWNVKTLNKSQLEEIQNEIKNLNLNAVKLCFEAVFEDDYAPVPGCWKILSNTIFNLKSTFTGDLRICRLSACSGKCSGGEDVILLCDKIKKGEIQIHFFEKDVSEDILWSAEANFNFADVHHQVAIPFKTPKYEGTYSKNLTDEDKVMVWVQLLRTTDGKGGEPRQFEYVGDIRKNSKKRKLSDTVVIQPELLEQVLHETTSGLDFRSFYRDDLSLNPSGGTFDDVAPLMDDDMLISGHGLVNTDAVVGDNLLMVHTSGVEDDNCYPNCPRYPFYPPTNKKNSNAKSVRRTTMPKFESVHKKNLEHQSYTGNDMPIGNMGSEIKVENDFMTLNSEMKMTDGQTDLTKSSKEKDSLHTVSLMGSKKIIYAASGVVTSHTMEEQTIANQLNFMSLSGRQTEQKLSREERGPANMGRFLKGLDMLGQSESVFASDTNGNSLLHLAVRENDENFSLMYTFLKFLQKGSVHHKNMKNETPLHLATRGNYAKKLKILLADGGNPSLIDLDGNNCLHLASIHNASECMEILLASFFKDSSDINSVNFEGLTPLHLSIIKNSKKCMRLLLNAKADVNISEKKSGRTPLHLAVDLQSSLVIELLSQSDIDVKREDYGGYTALQTACIVNDISYEDLSPEMKSDNQQIASFLMQLFDNDDNGSESSNYSTAESMPESETDEEEEIEKCEIENFLSRKSTWEKLGSLTCTSTEDLVYLADIEKNPSTLLIKKIKELYGLGDTEEDLLKILKMVGFDKSFQ